MECNAPKRLLAGGRFGLAFITMLLYLSFSIYFYLPHFNKISGNHFLIVFNPVLAAWGAYFLSKRWVNNWTPSLFAGAVYGFGPFALSFEIFHTLAGLSFVMVPWLLLPSVYWHRGKSPNIMRFCVRALLTLLPFAGIALLFWLPAQQWAGPFFLMPKDACMTVKDFTNLLFPLHKSGGLVAFGLYHCSLIFAVMGIFIYIKLQRVALLIPIAAGLVLSFSEPILQVSPIIWAAFPILFLSVLCGLGFQALSCAGRADTKWIVFCAIIASVLAAFAAGLGIRVIVVRSVFELTAIMYALTAAALWTLLALVRLNLRWQWFKWLVLTAAVTIDLFYSARFLIDKF